MCVELKSQFATLSQGKLVKATQSLEYLNVYFKGSLPSEMANKYLFVAIDEFSHLPFVIPCKDTYFKNLIQCLESKFFLCATVNYFNSDRGLGFLACDVNEYLLHQGVATHNPLITHKTMSRLKGTME